MLRFRVVKCQLKSASFLRLVWLCKTIARCPQVVLQTAELPCSIRDRTRRPSHSGGFNQPGQHRGWLRLRLRGVVISPEYGYDAEFDVRLVHHADVVAEELA